MRRLGEDIVGLWEECVASWAWPRPLVGCMRLKGQILRPGETPPQLTPRSFELEDPSTTLSTSPTPSSLSARRSDIRDQ